MGEEFKFDEIGYWSEIKLEIINDYAKEYMKILSKQNFLKPIYVDAFSGAGKHLSKVSKKEISGSPQNGLRQLGTQLLVAQK
jgi:three-Cys-motif partner protein